MKKSLFIVSFLSVFINLHAATKNQKVDSTMLNTIVAAWKSVTAKPVVADTEKCKNIMGLDSIFVTRVGSLKHYNDSSLVIIGDYVYVEVNNLKKLFEYQCKIKKPTGKDTASMMILFINGNPMYDIPVLSFDRNTNRCIFALDRQSKFLPQLYPLFTYMTTTADITLSLGFKNGNYVNENGAGHITMKYMSTWLFCLAIIIILLIVIGIILLGKFSVLLRVGETRETQYSLAMSQLTFWTVVITMSYFYIWISTQEMSPITGSTLILLAVSMTTAVGAKLVDKNRNVDVNTLKESRGFFRDIVSDEDGPSIHRCQMVLWTMIVGVIFIYSVAMNQVMPQIDSGILGLMGISSLGYLGLKNYEPKPVAKTEQQQQQQQQQEKQTNQ